jgi:phosphodiesterase/alkaline phosphatase D-like protein
MNTQTVYFNNPADIVNLQTTTSTQTTQITSMSGSVYQLRAHENDLGKNYGKFLHGVMSGDPTSTSIILSTTLTVDQVIQDSYHVYCMVSTGCLGDFTNPSIALDPSTLVSKCLIRVSKCMDFNAKVKISGLTANTQYYYKFYSIVPAAYSQANQQYLLNQRGTGSYNEFTTDTFYDASPIGRFKTLPTGVVSNLRFAAINCQNISCGFFNHLYQMAKIAQSGKLDYLLSCGDLYYQDIGSSRADLFFKEAIDSNGMKTFPITYEQFCQIYRVYKQDPDWQECFRSLSLIYLWDDHDAVRNGWMVNSVDKERLYFGTDAYCDYNLDGSLWPYSAGANARTRPSKVDGRLQITYTTGPMDNTQGMLKRATRAWYDSNPVEGLYFASNSTDTNNASLQNDTLYISQQNGNVRQFLGTTTLVGYPNWTSTGGLAPLEKTYKFGDLVSVHILDDMSQNYMDPALLNPYYNSQLPYHPLYPPVTGTYTLIPNPSGPFTTVFIPPVGSVTGCSSMPRYQTYNLGGGVYNTGAFLADLKTVVLYNNYVSCTRKGLMDYQMTGLYNSMTGAGTKWKVILSGMRGGLTTTNPVSDGLFPSGMSSTVKNVLVTDSLGYYSSTYFMTGSDADITLEYLARANRELYASGAVDYPLVYWKDADFQKQKRNGLMLTSLLSNFNNCIVLAGDKHDHYVANMHSPQITASIFDAGRNATGVWNNYTTGSLGAVNNSVYPVVGAYFSPQHNSIGELNESSSLRSQSTREKQLQNGSQDLAKYQDPRIVDFNYNFLNNLKGFTLFDFSSTGCDAKYFFVGGYDVGNTSLAPINFIVPGGNGIIPGLDAYNKRIVYRDNKLELSCRYSVPFNTGTFQGTSPIQIVKPTVKWAGYDFLPEGYPYKVPVNCTTASDFINYNTPYTISQL